MYSTERPRDEAISEPTREATAKLRWQDVSVGGAPEIVLIQRDKTAARAVSLRSQGLSMRQIGERLREERILPPRSDAWHAASVRDLLLDAERRPIAV